MGQVHLPPTTREQLVATKKMVDSIAAIGPIYVSAKQLEGITSIRYCTWEAWRRKGLGPRWISVSKRKVLYELASVQAWLDARAVQSTAEADLLPEMGA